MHRKNHGAESKPTQGLLDTNALLRIPAPRRYFAGPLARHSSMNAQPRVERLDPRIRRPVRLTRREFDDLVTFVRTGLLDPRATPENFARLIPPELPSRLDPLEFEPTD